MGKYKKGNLIIKTWERCKSIGRGRKGNAPALHKSRSLPSIDVSLVEERRKKKNRVAPEGCFTVYVGPQRQRKKNRVAPEGCFTVYVGPQRQRFVIKTEYANHPLFKILLEEAESEYGYNSEGPLVLPCKVDLFCNVLLAMDDNMISLGCRFPRGHSSYHLLSPPWIMATNQI